MEAMNEFWSMNKGSFCCLYDTKEQNSLQEGNQQYNQKR